jgi:hypothetical protein
MYNGRSRQHGLPFDVLETLVEKMRLMV